MTKFVDDPFRVLGVSESATEEEIRARYLQLVKQYPPDTNPEKFRQIQAAFTVAKDPLMIARMLLSHPDADDPPQWADAIAEHQDRPPTLTPELILSLGNRNEQYQHPESASDQILIDPPHE